VLLASGGIATNHSQQYNASTIGEMLVGGLSVALGDREAEGVVWTTMILSINVPEVIAEINVASKCTRCFRAKYIGGKLPMRYVQ
jgi:hypothetical protein